MTIVIVEEGGGKMIKDTQKDTPFTLGWQAQLDFRSY